MRGHVGIKSNDRPSPNRALFFLIIKDGATRQQKYKNKKTIEKNNKNYVT